MLLENYDVVVIGGGPGGYVCAIRCVQEGLKTLLIEKKYLGGTCLNAGCIPTKSLLQSAKIYEMAKTASQFGVLCRDIKIDFDGIMKRKDEVVLKLRRGVESLAKGNGCTLMTGEASFIDQSTLNISNGSNQTKVSFKNAVVATGSYATELPIDGIETVNWVNSDGFLNLKELPKRVHIVGTGVIGMEFCTFLNAIGVEVTMFDILPEILNGIDNDIVKSHHNVMQKKGVVFYLDAKIKRFERKGEENICYFEKDGATSNVAADLIIMATGRRPNTNGLNCENIGVKTEKGFICIDDYCKTNLGNVFAIGDVNGKAMLAHAASEQGMVVAHNLSSNQKQKADFTLIPSCVYTEPEIANIGLNESKAKALGIDVTVGRFDVSANGKSLVMGGTEGFVKVVGDKKTGEILGLQLYCAHATDMIGEGIAAIKLESTLQEISDAIHPHPTVNEMIMEAVHDALGHSAHKIKR
jgi:dihydrolipoamide dehydrogenase